MDWLPLLDPTHFLEFILAQTSTSIPKPTAIPEVELLKSQLQFIKDMNVAFLGFLGVVGALLTWIFNKNLEDAKRVAREMVRQELTNHLTPLVQAEAETVMRSLRVEQVIGDTVVDYCLPASDDTPTEYKILKERGFLDVRLWNGKKKPNKRLGSVVVLDLVNSQLLMNIPGLTDRDDAVKKAALIQREAIINEKISEIVDLKSGRAPVWVIYVRPGVGRIEAIDKLTDTYPEIKFYTSANTPVALMGAVVDSSYVAYGARSLKG
jgi:hypothetical protein